MDKSQQFWSSLCQVARANKRSGEGAFVLYATHGFTALCFAFGIVFSGIWLNRWRRIKRSNAELLQSVWRFTGLFLSLSFATCVFGFAAWISKIVLIPTVTTNSSYASLDLSQCRDFLTTEIRGVRSLSAFRISNAFEFSCLFLSILLGVDRISEQALSAKKFSKLNALENSGGDSPDPRASVGASVGRKGTAVRNQQQPLLLMHGSQITSSMRPEFSRTRALQLVFKAGVAFVALCFIAALISVVTAALTQANVASDYNDALSFCDGKGNNEDAFKQFDGEIAIKYDGIILKSIFAGWVTEAAAATAIILLYVAVGSLSLSIIVSARKKLEASRSKLQQLRRNLNNDRDVQAATAGARPAVQTEILL
jgi:hypothetical protein